MPIELDIFHVPIKYFTSAQIVAALRNRLAVAELGIIDGSKSYVDISRIEALIKFYTNYPDGTGIPWHLTANDIGELGLSP